MIPFAPSDISNLFGWYDANVGVAGGTSVTAWQDQSGNGNNLATFLTYSPETITAAINGLPAIATKSSGAALMSTPGNLPDNVSNGMTVFIVASQSETGSINDNDGAFYGAGNIVQLKRPTTTDFVTGKMRSASFLSSPTAIINGTFYTHRLWYDGTNQKIAVNNAIEQISAIVAGSYSADKFNLFGAGGYGASGNKSIAEVIIYTIDLTPTEINNVETYLKTKYNHY